MKSIFALALTSILFASNAFAAHACIISSADNAALVRNEYHSQIYITCDGGNKETRTITLKKSDDTVTNVNIATVIAELATKGYKVVSQHEQTWTMVNEAP